MHRTIYFGPPGTGKTTTLLTRLEEELKRGVPAERIAFLTFTRRARTEGVERVGRVLGIRPKDLPFFRTIHSMAFRALKLREGDVMGYAELGRFGEGMGLRFGRNGATETAAEGLASQELGDVLLALDNLARVRGEPLQKTWRDARTNVDWPVVDQFARSYAQFKRDTGLLDFTDVLAEFVKTATRLPVDVAFIDEAQDLSALQWYAALQAVEGATVQYVAGDDDQAIYRWAGADVQTFIRLEGQREVLTYSHRLPTAIHALALRISSRIRSRVDKQFRAREAPGLVRVHGSMATVTVGAEEGWLWLVRNRYLIPQLTEELASRGVVYTQHGLQSVREGERDAIYDWERLKIGRGIEASRVRAVYKFLRAVRDIKHGHKTLPGVPDEVLLTETELRLTHGLIARGSWFEVLQGIPGDRRAYYRTLLRRHGTLQLKPQVQVETIHGSKGAEASHVALFLEQSRRVWDEAQREPDDEHRVWYVGATRAREALHVVRGTNRWGYELTA